jgi:carbon monoxide dehydrogenase subunit G
MAGGAISIVIRRPVADVFAYMNDVSREHEWQPALLHAKQEPAGPTAVGSRRSYRSEFMGRRAENTYVVRVWEPNRHVVVESTPDSTLDATSDVRWEAVDGGTKVTMSVEGAPKGAMRLIPRKLLESTMEKETKEALGRLKQVLES